MNKSHLTPSPDIAQKLTEWKNEPSLLTLKTDLESAKPAHTQQMSKIQKWDDLSKVKNSAAPPKVQGRSSVQPKLIRRQAEWRYSALTEPFLGSHKLITVNPTTAEDREAARQNELVLNWQFRTKINRVKFIDELVRTDVDEGTAIIRTGWKRHVVKVKEQVPVFNHYPIESEEQLEPLQQALDLKQENPRGYDETVSEGIKAAVEYYEETGVPTYTEEVGTQEVEVDKILQNHPTVDVMNPHNVYIDPSCEGDIDRAMFAIVSFETNHAELKKEPERYKNLDKVDWQNNSNSPDPEHATNTPVDFQFKDATRKKVVAYEYWGFYDINKDGNLSPIVATWIGATLIRMELNPFPDEKLPFIVIPYLPIKRELYGESDAELLEDNQKILGAVTRGLIDLMGKSANAQQGFAKGMLDPLNRRRFEQGQDYEYNPNQSPNMGLITHKYPELPRSALDIITLQNQEAEALTGVKSFAGGMSGESFGDVAAGIRGVLDAASKREMAILRRLAKGITELASKIIAMNSVFLTEKEVVRVTNEEFVIISREDLKGNFDLETDISTAEVDNAKAQDLGFMLQTIGPNTDTSIVMMILGDIAELKRMPDLAHKLRNFKPQPSPEEQEMMQLELEEKRKQVELLQSEINLNNAKAEQAMADKDNRDLQFMNDQNGTTHKRNMEQQKAQSQGNQNLQVTKALTTPIKDGERAPNIEAAIGFNGISDKLSEIGNAEPTGVIQRDQLAADDNALNIGSQEFDSSRDPALNPNINI